MLNFTICIFTFTYIDTCYSLIYNLPSLITRIQILSPLMKYFSIHQPSEMRDQSDFGEAVFSLLLIRRRPPLIFVPHTYPLIVNYSVKFIPAKSHKQIAHFKYITSPSDRFHLMIIDFHFSPAQLVSRNP